MPKSLLARLITNLSGAVRRETLHGIEYLVVPTVMIVEGVLNGSQGPIYYPADELCKMPAVWNSKPVVVSHPIKGSATDPGILESTQVGMIMNTVWDAPKLRCETWLNINLANKVDKRIIEKLEANEPIEVSTGLWTENEDVAGTFGESVYTAIAHNFRPDHLAILPDGIGACSIAAGAGLLQLNSSGEQAELTPIQIATMRAVTGSRPVINEQSYQWVSRNIYDKIYSRFGYNADVEAVFESFFIYRWDGKVYKLTYSKTDKEVVIGTDPVEVYPVVKYLTANGALVANVADYVPQSGVINMTKAELVTKLIANAVGYDESDRPALEAMTEAKLGSIVAATTKPPVVNSAPPILKDPAPAPAPVKAATVEEYVANAPPQIQEILNQGLIQSAAAKAALVAEITANKSCQFTPEYLQSQPIQFLQGIAQFARGNTPAAPVANYFGAQGVPPVTNKAPQQSTEEAYVMPTMNFEANKVA